MHRWLRSVFTLGIILAQLGLALGVMTALPRPAAPGVPAGFTDTPTPVETSTPTPTPTEPPTATPQPTETPTPIPTVVAATEVPPPAATEPPPALPEPVINKSVNLEQARPGDEVIFGIEIVNPAPVALEGVIVSDALSPLVDYLGADVPRGDFGFDSASRVWTLNLGTLGPNERVTFSIRTRVGERAIPPDTLVNTAVLTSPLGARQSNTTTTDIIPRQLPVTGR